MPRTLLNEDQQRRVGTHLSLLASDLAAFDRLPELAHRGSPYDEIHALLAQLRDRTEHMRVALGLPADHAPNIKHRLAALAGVWSAHLEDLRARRLRAYGHVNPDLAPHLDPHLDSILDLLHHIERAADELPEG